MSLGVNSCSFQMTGLNRATCSFPAKRTEGAFVANKFVLAFVIKITQGGGGAIIATLS